MSVISVFPIVGFEAHKDGVAVHHNRPLDQHAIGSQQPELFLLGHQRELFLELHGFVKKAAGIEEAAAEAGSFGVPGLQLVVGGFPP